MPHNAQTIAPAVNPHLPLELENGTPCDLIEVTPEHNIRVLVHGDYTGRYPEEIGPDLWYYKTSSGLWCGSSPGEYPRLRNAAPVANTEPFGPFLPATHRFEVRQGETGTDRDDWSSVAEFTDGKRAAQYVAEHKASSASSGKSLVIVKVAISAEPNAWREREEQRLADGTYTPLPGDWFTRIQSAYPDHYVHIATGDKRKVAFTETASAGERDRQKVLTPGLYMERFFSGSNGSHKYWPSVERQEFCAAIIGADIEPLIVPLGDSDMLEQIYIECGDNGASNVSSCMSHPAEDYSSHIHPVRVYSEGGDLTLAFLRLDGMGNIDPEAELEGDGEIGTRCLIWPAKKLFGRIYGDASRSRVLRSALEAQGYSCNAADGLAGARLAKIEHGDSDEYVMPYIDGGNHSFSDSPCGPYFVMQGGQYEGDSTGGTVSLDNRLSECEHCGDSYNSEASGYYVHTSRRNVENWCDHCGENEATFVSSISEYVHNSCVVTYYDDNNHEQTCGDWELEATGAILCDDGEYRVDAFHCHSCAGNYANSDHAGQDSDGDDICNTCHAEAEAEANKDQLILPLVAAAAA